ncbi:hypothetical protein FisN_1Lh292 [Fistulifera solaris]|uniref:RanBP2-type domain-containing protein n=1 Tax=Fistulifera solaris TaxID=1519565 RepID=A0A1Z5K4A3_FISSO|nr:hypothetical protein FisN_1Lh292 [Fistulifera solaris]|eukprot:GAX21036.1 hypothetical protein FisN_1Lh292 [Fistulifera solaris]
MNEDKKRKPFLKLIANSSKRPRVATISSSGGKRKAVSSSATDNGGVGVEAVGETSVPPKKGDLEKGCGALCSDPNADSCPPKIESREWVCLMCTLHNSGNRKRCQACGTREPIMNDAPPVEVLHDPLSRTVYSTPALNNMQQKDSSIVMKLVKKLDTPMESRVNKPKTPIQSPSTIMKSDNKSRALASTANSEIASSSKRNGNNERSPSAPTGLKTTAFTNKELSKSENSVSAIRDARLAPAQIPRDQETPIMLHGNQEQIQQMLVSIVDRVESLSKHIHAHRDDIQSLRIQSEEILMMQKQTLHETQEMRASLTNFLSGQDAEHSHAGPAEAFAIRVLQKGVSQEATNGGNTRMVTGIALCCVSLIAALIHSK